jgi:PII-like signaling protein
MQVPGEAVRLRLYIGANDTWQGEALVDALIRRAREQQMAGATAMRGVSGFGNSAHIHRIELVLSHDLPIVVEIIDTADKIDAFLPAAQEMIATGLVTREAVTVLRYGAAAEAKE